MSRPFSPAANPIHRRRESFSASALAVVTEVNRFQRARFSEHRILVAETPAGWRVLNPV